MPNYLLFFPQVKNKPYRPGEQYAFILENGAVANRKVKTIYEY